jgi:hypothetical protein
VTFFRPFCLRFLVFRNPARISDYTPTKHNFPFEGFRFLQQNPFDIDHKLFTMSKNARLALARGDPSFADGIDFLLAETDSAFLASAASLEARRPGEGRGPVVNPTVRLR